MNDTWICPLSVTNCGDNYPDYTDLSITHLTPVPTCQSWWKGLGLYIRVLYPLAPPSTPVSSLCCVHDSNVIWNWSLHSHDWSCGGLHPGSQHPASRAQWLGHVINLYDVIYSSLNWCNSWCKVRIHVWGLHPGIPQPCTITPAPSVMDCYPVTPVPSVYTCVHHRRYSVSHTGASIWTWTVFRVITVLWNLL